MLVTTLESDPFLGRILTGRIQSGTIKPNTTLKALMSSEQWMVYVTGFGTGVVPD